MLSIILLKYKYKYFFKSNKTNLKATQFELLNDYYLNGTKLFSLVGNLFSRNVEVYNYFFFN